MKGAPVAANMLQNLTFNSEDTLHIFSNQSDPASVVYVRNKQKKCIEVGLSCCIYNIAETSIDQFLLLLSPLLILPHTYIIIQKPLPAHLVTYEKDIDALIQQHPLVDIDAFGGDLSTEFKTPATPLGIMKMLDYYIGLPNLRGLDAVVIGRSEIVGKPMAQLLLQQDCTVTICHSHTKNLEEKTRRADLIVSAAGKPKLITASHIGGNRPIIVDVGINRDAANKLCGDVDFESVSPLCRAISPVPGGVGVLTVASLIYKMGKIV